MREMLYAALISRCLCVVAQLGVPDLMAGGARTVNGLAAAVEADPATLRRLLRGLASFDVFVERPGDAFDLTPLGRSLCGDATASALPTALLVGGPVGTVWGELLQTVRTGSPSFDRLRGLGFFEYLEAEPGMRAVFDQSQATGLELELDEVLDAVDLSGYATIVDVGGGEGTLLSRLLRARPAAHGVLTDLPGTVALARDRLGRDRLLDRCTLVAGDFFREVPSGGDLYLLSHVLHDWDDERAVRVLRTCRTAMRPGSVLLVIELIAPAPAPTSTPAPTSAATDSAPADRSVALMDLYMMSLFGGTGGKERTEDEMSALLDAAGFEPARIRRLPSGMGVFETTPLHIAQKDRHIA
jgi:hypothetical protein